MKVHFIGIGGIGVSALAQYYLAKGHEVSGSDLVSSEITDSLLKKGAKIFIGKEDPLSLAKKFDLIIHTPAVNVEHRVSNILSYPEALGELTKQYFTIAVSGTHGKTTTTAMIGLILVKAGFDPTVIVGTKLKEFGDSNCRVGKSKYLVIEADEHFASFLNYWPKMAVITNIEADHLDYYKNFGNIKKAYSDFVSHLPKDGILITEKSLNKEVSPNLKKILKVPGAHNIYDASLALAAARALKIPDKISVMALSEYKGAWRRFEIVQTKPFVLISDYGHNPAKAMAGMAAAREKYPAKKIWCLYQPHQYQRTHYLFDDFVKTFRRAPVDKIIITDIYDVAGREEKKIKKNINSQKLVTAINKENVVYLPNKKILPFLRKNLDQMQVLIIMGAGDIYEFVDKLIDRTSKQRENKNKKRSIFTLSII